MFPTASFTFSPSNDPPTAPRAGDTVIFSSTSSDADGSVTQWTYNFGDGTSESGSGPPPDVSHVYANAGSYTVTLEVHDNNGNGYTTGGQRVKVSGPGQKTSLVKSVPECTVGGPGTLTLDVYIPSWAQTPTLESLTDPICPGIAQTVTMTELDGDAPSSEPNDAHDARPRIFRITVELGPGVSAEAGSWQATVSWD